MLGFVVKNTLLRFILDLICPNYCMFCGEIGAILCERCRKNIISGYENRCPICHKVIRKRLINEDKNGEKSTKEKVNLERGFENKKLKIGDFCLGCETGFMKTIVIGRKNGAMMKMIKEYKYKQRIEIGEILGEMMAEVLGEELGELGDMVIVPLPTARRHIRERGFCHMTEIAKSLGKKKGVLARKLLKRKNNKVQVGADMETRKKQAKTAYELANSESKLDSAKTYILIDDVWTTGSSMMAGKEVLASAGAKKIIGVVFCLGGN